MILTYKYRIKSKQGLRSLCEHAFAINQVWNFLVALKLGLSVQPLAEERPLRSAQEAQR